MLLSQSEYVKGELTKLKIQLQKLEVRASSIEVDIRDAMSQGMHVIFNLFILVEHCSFYGSKYNTSKFSMVFKLVTLLNK